MISEVLGRHRGPYRFMVTRPKANQPDFATSEWLKGNVDSDDVESEALALLTDPRDTIHAVHVWSETEQQFVTQVTQ